MNLDGLRPWGGLAGGSPEAADVVVAGIAYDGSAAYRRGALPEVVEEGVSGFFAEPDDFDGLADAIRRCLTLDRHSVRSSALKRLGIEDALDGYELALREVAR